MKAQKLSPTMLKFLKDWELNTANHNRLTAEIEKYVYDNTFFTEQRGLGEIKYEMPGNALLKLTPQKIKGQVSRLKDPSGKPYKLEGIMPARWVSTGKEIIQIDDKEKTYNVMLIPPDMQGERLNEGPIPFLFGMKAEEAQRRYHFFELKRKKNPNHPNSFSFRAVPQRRVDLQEYKYADVILDVENYVPIAIKLTSPTGNAITVYLFKPETTKVNPKKGFFDRGPFIDPDVKGYKLVNNNPGAQAVPGGGRPAANMQPGDARPQANEPKPGRLRISGDKNPVRK